MTGTDGHETTRPRVSRYDLVLAIIPSAFVAVLLAANVLSLSPRTALGTASLVAAIVLVDALFLNPPRGPGSSPDRRLQLRRSRGRS